LVDDADSWHDDGSSVPRQFKLLTAAETVQVLLRQMVAWARRAAPSRLWRYLLMAFTRRSNDASWSMSPPGQVVASSRRPPRGPNSTQMARSLVICGESFVCL
jgi:hypothetical protein